MSFSLAPSKKVLRARETLAQLLPEYKPFTHVTSLPESLLTLCKGNQLLHLHTNYTPADSLLKKKEPRTVGVQIIPVPSPPAQSQWITLLELDPKAFVFALLSDSGTLLFLELQVRLTDAGSRYQAVVLTSTTVRELCDSPRFTSAISICLNGFRFLLLKDGQAFWHVLHCDVVDFELSKPDEMALIVQDILLDYGTENNVLGVKLDVVYYKKEAIATVPLGFHVISVFGVQCDAFQLLVKNESGVLEWWRWTGEECEAVVLPVRSCGVPMGNLLWF